MFGAPWIMLVKPLTKNFLLIIMITMASAISMMPTPTWFSYRTGGTGKFHM